MDKEYIEPMKPIIEQIMSSIRTQQEDAIMRAVCDCGIVVDKERLVQALTEARAFYEEGYRAAMNAADVVEVVHGRWEYLQDDEWRCSNCHTVFNTGGKWIPMTDNFCSECGADMRERRDDE